MSGKKAALGLLSVLFLIYGVYTYVINDLSNNINGTFKFYSDETGDEYYFSALEDKSKFYIFSKDLGVFEEGTFQRVDLYVYSLNANFINEQEIHIRKRKFFLYVDNERLIFEKISEVPILEKDLYENFLKQKNV